MGALRGFSAALTAVLGVCCASASGVTVTFQAIADNTLYAESPGNSNGAGDFIFVGRNTGTAVRRGLVHFDLGSIPPGSTITSASLTMHVSRTQVGPRLIAIHRMLTGWGEGGSDAGGSEAFGVAATPGSATWSHSFFNTTPWANAGGTFLPQSNAAIVVDAVNTDYTWTGIGVVQDVTTWVNNPATNAGWCIIGDESTRSSKRFNSRTNPYPETRPRLTVTFTPSIPMGACCFNWGDCALRTAADCAIFFGTTYLGDGTSCDPTNPCFQPVAACCLSNGSCIMTTPGPCSASTGTFQGPNTNCSTVACPIQLIPYVDALPIPPIAVPTSGTAGGVATYMIESNELWHQCHSDLPLTRVWGYNNSFPGPTILASKGNQVTVTWKNNIRDPDTNLLRIGHLLPVDTCLHGLEETGTIPVNVVHLHGAKVSPSSDGDPEATFMPGSQSAPYFYPNNQDAATLWYHDHALGMTRLNVMMGLAGFYLLTDTAEQALNLPTGQYDIPLVIQDRSFNPDGSLKYQDVWHDHFFGDFILVNGKVWPFLFVDQGKYRFRILNGSNSRTYTLSLNQGATMRVIANDQGLLAAPITVPSITVQPGERIDVVIDFEQFLSTTTIEMTNSAPVPFPNGEQGPDVAPVMQFIVAGQVGDTDPLPVNLVPYTPIPVNQASQTRQFRLNSVFDPVCAHDEWKINNQTWDVISENVVLNSTEIWTFLNRSHFTHPMHIHLVKFQILDRQAVDVVNFVEIPVGPLIPPAPWESGWKDVVQCPPNMLTRVIMKFEGFTGVYPYHCHILEHEDHEMMREFRVTCPGDFNSNCIVNAADLSVLLSSFGTEVAPGQDGDTNFDGLVNAADLSVLLSRFGAEY